MIDGKEMRWSFDKAAEQSNLNIVTAFAHDARLCLGITKSAKGGGEILALRELIEMLDIRGITITADALHCQRETCELILEHGGDYCLQRGVISVKCWRTFAPLRKIKTLIILMNRQQPTPIMDALKNAHTGFMTCLNTLKRPTIGRD